MITYQGEQIEVFDAHTHMGRREQVAIHQIPRILSFMPEEMVARMDQSQVDRVVTFPIGAGTRSDYAQANRLMAQAMRDYPGRIVGFMRLNPNFGVEHNRQLLQEGVSLGLKGIKFHPLIEQFQADDCQLVYPLLGLAEEHQLTVLYDCNIQDWTSPDRIGRVARDFPGVNIIFGHSGLVEGLRQVVQYAKELPNVYMDSSAVGWIPYFCESIAYAGAERVLYGSDTPFNPMAWEIDKIVKYASQHLELSVEQMRQVLGGNIRRLLRM